MMTQEEKITLAYAVLAARKRGDHAEVKKLQDMMPLSENMAKCALLHYGVNGLEQAKSSGLNFSDMEEKYGLEWYQHV